MIEDAVICVSNVGIIERGRITQDDWYTIDKIILKKVNGKRSVRYAVCINGCWETNQRMTWREAREKVSELRSSFIARSSATVSQVTEKTFQMVSDLANYASRLEEVGIIKKADRLRQVAGELENVSRDILNSVKA
jgi:hypothetical protein